ncbi:hypothetical protein HY633_04935 [Candidatus Uhrbacteria bacterium]|nr:hypothetical protein [Candidatus Uhrbacteria bacterium]
MGSPTGRKGSVTMTVPRVFAGLASLAVVATVAVGLFLAGSPNKERMRQFDGQRLSHLQTISSAVDAFYDTSTRLPESLAELSLNGNYLGKPGYYTEQTVDPATKQPYEYRVVSDKVYELCAVFDLTFAEAQAQQPYMGYPVAEPMRPYPLGMGVQDWTHPAGRHCFTLNAEERTARVACGLTNPCAAGQTCATLPNRKGSTCVPAGKECLAAGCPDACTIAESYPVQVRCAMPADSGPVLK